MKECKLLFETVVLNTEVHKQPEREREKGGGGREGGMFLNYKD